MSYFHKKQKTSVFLKTLYLGQKTFFSLKVWLSQFLNKDYPMDILKFYHVMRILDRFMDPLLRTFILIRGVALTFLVSGVLFNLLYCLLLPSKKQTSGCCRTQ